MAKLRGEGKLAARNALVMANQGLVHKVARRFRKAGVDYDALVQEGTVGLIRAADKYNPKRGRFSTYATPWIRAHIQRALGQGFTVRVPEKRLTKAHKQTVVSLDTAAREGQTGGIDAAHLRASVAHLRKRVLALPAQQARVMRLRYWANGHLRPEPWTVRQVAKKLRLSPGRVSQLEQAARKRLRQAARQ
jgi:RNA polymerase sigma factor (sigma-70 family)